MNKFCMNFIAGLSLLFAAGGAYASEKVLDINEEKFQDDKPLPSSADRGASMMMYPYFERATHACPRDYASYEDMCRELQKAGVTELLDFAHEKIIPDDMHFKKDPVLDSKDKLVEIAGKYGIDKIWIIYSWRTYGRPMSQKDRRVNVMSPEFLEEQYNFIDAVAKKNKQYGKDVFGLFLDEPWYGSDKIDFDVHLDTFKAFCKREYGEDYPGTTVPVARGRDWWKQDASRDRWTRRFLVFQYCVYENFFKALCDYAHSKNVKTIMRSMYSPVYPGGWAWGLDPYRISKIGDYQWLPIGFLRLFNFENSLAGHYKDVGAIDFCRGVLGFPASYFIYDMYSCNPKNKVQYDELVSLSKRWQGAERIACTAVMTYPVGLVGGFSDPRNVFLDNDNMLWSAMDKLCPSDMIDVRDTRLYGKYKVLLAPRYCGWSVPQYVIDDLKKFVSNGGILISFDARFAVGKRDLTNPDDVSGQLYGAELADEEMYVGDIKLTGLRAEQVLKGKSRKQRKIRMTGKSDTTVVAVNPSGNEPVIIENKIGKGKVIYVNLDFAARAKSESSWKELPLLLAKENITFPVSIDGGLRFQSVIRKEGSLLFSVSDRDWGMAYSLNQSDAKWIAAWLNAVPDRTEGTLKIDAEGLALTDESFQVMTLSRNTPLKTPAGSMTWSRDDLKKGIPVTVEKSTGYENIVVEPLGRKYTEKGIAAKLRDVQEQWNNDSEQAHLHPAGLGADPFRKRIRLETEESGSGSSAWQSRMPYRFILDITPPPGTLRFNQPVILDRKQLAQKAGGDLGRMELFKDGEKNKTDIQASPDEIAFVDSFKNGKTRYILYFDRDSTIPDSSGQRHDKTDKIETPFYSVEINGNGVVSINGQDNMPGLRLNGPGGFEVMARAYRTPGSVEWKARGPVHFLAEYKTVDKGITFKTVYEFFNGSPYVRIAYSSNQDNPLRQLEKFFYWPIGYLTGKTDAMELFAGTGKWIRPNCRSENWAFLPFAGNSYVLVRRKDSGFAWILLASAFVKSPHIMMGASQLYFITRFSESHNIPTLVKKPYAEFMYVAGISNEADAEMAVAGLKNEWIVNVRLEKNDRALF